MSYREACQAMDTIFNSLEVQGDRAPLNQAKMIVQAIISGSYDGRIDLNQKLAEKQVIDNPSLKDTLIIAGLEVAIEKQEIGKSKGYSR